MSDVATEVAESRKGPTRLERVLFTPSLVDWFFVLYAGSVLVGLTLGHASSERDHFRHYVAAIVTLFLGGVYTYRVKFERGQRTNFFVASAYRILPVACMLAIYFNLRAILPIINGADYDEKLYQLDLRIFGVEPTIFLERFSTRGVVEWFAGFYYSYFVLAASFTFVMIFSVTDERRRAIFATGLLMVNCVGWFAYTLVPGLGPYAHLAHEYQAPLQGGPFYRIVVDTVAEAGALRDIFPSLHTALPTFCALYSWRYYRRIAPLITFIAINIMIATLVLRWHYGVDVLAGLTLAVTAFLVSPKLVDGYQMRRESIGLGDLGHW